MQSTQPSPAGGQAVPAETVHRVSIVVPVYQGERTLEALVGEIEPLTRSQRTPQGRLFRVDEVVLTHDGATDDSASVIEALAARHPFVVPIWLSRNFGQHSATLAGMAASSAEWVATMDEDGQHDPRDVGPMLDRALEGGAQLVYASPTNPPPHGRLRNRMSDFAKWVFVALLGNREIGRFHSFRLVHGEIARSLAAYCGTSVYLDVALSWVVGSTESCPVRVRGGSTRRSGYNFRKLAQHFIRLLLTSGTKPLRLISLLGVLSVLLGLGITAWAVWGKLTQRVPVQGWTSTMIVLCVFSGCILFSLGVIAEYLGVMLTMTMGKPLFLTVSRPPPRKKARP
ncbi:MAG: glycosyltransferase [Planctomycetes bacterium]|nr:glycosyltransferase [Planctomycetota bacterium]